MDHPRKESQEMKKTYKIDVDCANCANKMEAAAAKVEGVTSVSVNFMNQKMTVEFASDIEDKDEKKVMKEVRKQCRKVEDDCEIYIC
jgi:copper chaperone CopZ